MENIESFCKGCNKEELLELLDLGEQPICNKFIDEENNLGEEKKYPLRLSYCPNCHLLQLAEVPPLEEVFGDNFNYISGSTPEAVSYFENIAKDIRKKYEIGEDEYIIDIGSSDGTFLKQFDYGRVLGIEPTPKPCRIAKENGIDTLNRRFEGSIDKILEKTDNNIKVITAFNVLAHTDKIHEFLEGISKILSENPNAVFISQSHYLENLIENREYDTIYHEHARYYSLTSLRNLFEKYGLNIYDAEKVDYYGGSILVTAGTKEKRSQRVDEILKRESKYKNPEIYERFAEEVKENKKELRNMIEELKDNGKNIVGVGAPMKSSTLLNYCDIDNELIDYVTERNELKIGKRTPGTHIPVKSDQALLEDNPDVALILSWNVSDRIISSLKEKGYTGDFILPIPEPQFIEN